MQSSARTQVAIVFTGGTISMVFDASAAGAVPGLTCEEIVARTPGLRNIAELRLVDFARLPGPHMTPARMLELARVVETQLADPGIAGVAVTHGTDTLEESAYLLDLVLHSEKPVAFLGALRHSSELGWDGPANLTAAVRVAASPAARGLGVLVVMNQLVLSAADVTKTHTQALGTFAARDAGPLGIVELDKVLVNRARPNREHIPADRLEESVEIVKFSAGSDGRALRMLLDAGLRGLVIEGLGCGNVPITALPEVERALASRIPVVITSRCATGRVLDSYAYAGAGRPLRKAGAILGGSLPSHKARLKLMLLLGAGADLETIRQSFEETP